MAFQIIVLPKAEKELKKLPRKEFLRIDEAILQLADNPRPVGYKKLHCLTDIYRLKVGDYRIVYRIEDAKLVIEVIRIANRKDVYRNLA